MPNSFETQINKIVINTEARLLAVTRQSISDLVEEVQTPVAKGGKMRVVTGFLRSTGLSSLNAPPSGPVKGDRKGKYLWSGEPVNITLGNMQIGDTFYFGWTARYAKFREIYDGFLESGLQNWQRHVDKAVQFFRDKDMR